MRHLLGRQLGRRIRPSIVMLGQDGTATATALDEALALLAKRPEYVGISNMRSWILAQVDRLPAGEREGAALRLAQAAATSPDGVTIYNRQRGQGEAFVLPDTAGALQMTPYRALGNRIQAAFIPAGHVAKFAALYANQSGSQPQYTTTEKYGPRWVLFEPAFGFPNADGRGRQIYYVYAMVRDARTQTMRDQQAARVSAANVEETASTQGRVEQAASTVGLTPAELFTITQQRLDAEAAAQSRRDAQALLAQRQAEAQAELEQRAAIMQMERASGSGSNMTVALAIGGALLAVLAVVAMRRGAA